MKTSRQKWSDFPFREAKITLFASRGSSFVEIRQDFHEALPNRPPPLGRLR
jgi:hypothetical protein